MFLWSAGIAAVIGGVVWLETQFGVLSGTVDWVSGKLSTLWGWFRTIFSGDMVRTAVGLYLQYLTGLFTTAQHIFTGVFGFVTRLFTEPVQLIKDTVANAVNFLPDWVVDRFDSLRSLRDSLQTGRRADPPLDAGRGDAAPGPKP